MGTDAAVEPRAKKSRLAAILVAVGLLGVVGVAALVWLRLTHTIYKQPSGSMWPTFAVGERFTASSLDKDAPRGRVVVFEYPEQREQLFFKRVVGVGGDTVLVKDGAVTLNGWPVPRCLVGETTYADTGLAGDPHGGSLFVEFLGEATYLVFIDKSAVSRESQGPYEVKPNEVFVLGDNRNNSHDSRTWFGGLGGGVPSDALRGRVRTPDTPKLPAGAESLSAALASCLAKRPATTSPPAK